MTLDPIPADLEMRNVRLEAGGSVRSIWMRDGTIVSDAATALDVLDAEGGIAMPGLIESHLHLDKCHVPVEASDLRAAIGATAKRKAGFTADDIEERASRLLDAAVTNGTTLVRAHTDVDPGIGLLAIETLVRLRAKYAELIDIQIAAFPQEGIFSRPGTVELLDAALDAGADVVGGCPYSESDGDDAREHLRHVFELAALRGLPLDLHLDLSDDITDDRFTLAGHVAELTETFPPVRVAISHVTSLGSLPPEGRARTIAALRDAGVAVVVLPHTDLHLGGRGDDGPVRRGLAPVRELIDGGVHVACSSNNVRNAFSPYGNGDALETALFLAQTAHLASREELRQAVGTVTTAAAHVTGVADGYGLSPGDRADLVVLDADDDVSALLDRAPRRWVIKRGRVVAQTRRETRIFRSHIA